MSKPSKKSAVELRPSRIRRDPQPQPEKGIKGMWADASEQETWIVVIGVTLFALALTVLAFGISDITSK